MIKHKQFYVKLAKYVLFCALVWFISRSLIINWQKIQDYSWNVNYGYFAISFVLLISAFVLDAMGWMIILRKMGINLSFIESARMWFLSHLARYIPGGIWQFASRIGSLKEAGFSGKMGLLSMHIEGVAMFASAVFVSVICYANIPRSEAQSHLIELGLICAACLLSIHPRMQERIFNFIFRKIGRSEIVIPYAFMTIISIIMYYFFLWWILCGAFFFFVRSVYLPNGVSFFELAFAFTASFALGLVAVFAPGGLGVREGALVIFLSNCLPAFISPIIAIASRLWLVSGEIFSCALILCIRAGARRL